MKLKKMCLKNFKLKNDTQTYFDCSTTKKTLRQYSKTVNELEKSVIEKFNLQK